MSLANSMPKQEEREVHVVRSKYGLNQNYNLKSTIDTKIEEDHFVTDDKRKRSYDDERIVLIIALEKIAKSFQKLLAQGEFIFDNETRFVEEFCTLIELCLSHGWNSKSQNLLF